MFIFYYFHPQIDSQIEVVKKSLGNLLWSLVRDNLKSWDNIIMCAEFMYNTFVNCTTGMSLFEIVHEYTLCKPSDLILLSPHVSVSSDGESFSKHIKILYEEIHQCIMSNNISYK